MSGDLAERLRIEDDGTIVALSGKVEYGQGIRTGFAKIVAEELRVPIDRVRVVLGETDRVPWDVGTFGSLSTATDGRVLRAAAVLAREQLLARAASRLGVDARDLALHDGAVHAPNGARSIPFAELVAGAPLTGPIPDAPNADAPPPPHAADAPMRLEAMAIVTGRARYAADVRLPGMLRGYVLHPPVYGARLRAIDTAAARAMPGVVAVVHEGDFVGVVAERHEQAMSAVRAIHAQWDPPPPGMAPCDFTLRADDGIDAALARAASRHAARFAVPHVANAPIGPSAAVADVREDEAFLYVATQRPFNLRDEAAQRLGLDAARVHVLPQMASGAYGRNSPSDAPLEAARLSRAVGHPVLVQWSRADELRASPHRPTVTAAIEAGLDASGAIVAWRYDERTNPHTYGDPRSVPERMIVETCARCAIPPYRLGAADVRLHLAPGEVRTGALRSLSAAPNVFAIESFVDDLARHVGDDPIAYRLRHVDDPRMRRVLEVVRDRSGWGAPNGAGRGRGVACAVYHGTYVAEVVEVTVAASGRVVFERAWCAIDPGRVVHPDGARNQVEGAIQMAASWTLIEELSHRDGRVVAGSWSDYPIATFRDAPRAIDVTFTGDDDAPPTGIGEPGAVPTAAAIANAVVDACGVRVRTLPLRPNAIRAAAAR